MLQPQYPAAVVAGNVETSQNITDALYGALGRLAACQGSMVRNLDEIANVAAGRQAVDLVCIRMRQLGFSHMFGCTHVQNNFTFGNDRHQYYETICSGTPAGPGFDGKAAVHAHMTNSRLTDPEVLEWRFPVRLETFSIRRGSGGDGQWRGGDGTLRRIVCLEPMTASILSCRRVTAPWGIAGGSNGQRGRNWVEREGGNVEELAGCDSVEMDIGDTFVIQTPTAGGYGPPGMRARADSSASKL